MAEGECIRPLAGAGDQLGGVGGARGRRYEHVGGFRHQADLLEIAKRVVGEVAHGVAVERAVGDAQHQPGVAVGPSTARCHGADHPIAARPVLDQHGLAQFATQWFGQVAEQRVGHAAGGEGDDDADGPVGPGLCQGRCGQPRHRAAGDIHGASFSQRWISVLSAVGPSAASAWLHTPRHRSRVAARCCTPAARAPAVSRSLRISPSWKPPA